MKTLLNKNIVFKVVQFVFVAVLFYLFTVYVGLPSWDKYQAKGTLITEKMVPNDFKNPPVITVCPRNSQGSGLKEPISGKTLQDDMAPFLERTCMKRNWTDITQCINNMGFNLTETIKSSNTKGKNILNNTKLWIEELNILGLPKCFTLNSTLGYGSVIRSSLEISLHPQLAYAVYIHDPNFFYRTPNPKTTPRTVINVNENFGEQFIYIQEILNTRLNTLSKPCNDTQEYSFTKCVKNRIR